MNTDTKLYNKAKGAGILNIQTSGDMTTEMFQYAIDSTLAARSKVDFKAIKEKADKAKEKHT